MQAAPMLRDARRLAGLTQRQLADRAGVAQATVGRIESGQITPRVDTLENLLRAAGQELTPRPRPGTGVDRSQILELLRLSPGQRLELAAADAIGLGRLEGQATRK
ncbi:MAG: helix-turn-helix domain-containing protein [Chloroflexota bacterium]|nr:helix-turn-helix domain-containing protein [Chloroflexota bacterium]